MTQILLLSGCASFFCEIDENDVAGYLNRRIQDPMSVTRVLPVYFASNRKQDQSVPGSCSNSFFSTDYDSKTNYGTCEVNVPFNHPVGSLDSSQQYLDRDQYFIMGNYLPANGESFFREQRKRDKEILLFVHGFNVKFEDAVFRSAQLVYDLKFSGDAIVYSWAAGEGQKSFFDSFLINKTYSRNLESAEKSREHFKNFLTSMVKTGRKINIIVHSMGHQVVLPVLAEIGENQGPVAEQIVLNAPDFPVDSFKALSNGLIQSGKRITMYCSPSDNALNVSEIVNWKARAGSCVNVDGIDVINVQQVDEPVMGIGGLGHGYYSGRAILIDLYQSILGVHPEKRLFIAKSKNTSNEDYIMRR